MLASRKNQKQRHRALPAIVPSAQNAPTAYKVLSLNTIHGAPVFFDARTGVIKVTVQGRTGIQNSMFRGTNHSPQGCTVITDSGLPIVVSSQDGKAIDAFASQFNPGRKASTSKIVIIVTACVLFATLLVFMASNHT